MSEDRARALIVEDDRAWQQILSEILTDMGLLVEVADSVASATAALRAAPHRLAVVDLALGSDHRNQEGLQVLDTVRRLDPGCATLLLTGYATVEIAVSALVEHGAFTCLRKEAFRRAEFRELVHRALASAPAGAAPVGALLAAPSTQSGQASSPEPPSLALLAEDDAGWQGILSELLTDAGYQPRLASSYGEALGYLRRDRFALAVVDLSLEGTSRAAPVPLAGGRGVQDGFGYRLLASTRAGGIPTIVVTGVASSVEIERAYAEQGIFACLEKQTFSRRAFLQTVQEARAALVETPYIASLPTLTGREREVLELLARGWTSKEIAEKLVITQNTVKRHLKAIFEKLAVHTRAAAAAKAIGAGLPAGWAEDEQK